MFEYLVEKLLGLTSLVLVGKLLGPTVLVAVLPGASLVCARGPPAPSTVHEGQYQFTILSLMIITIH